MTDVKKTPNSYVRTMPADLSAVARDLSKQGWSVVANVFPHSLCLALRDDIETLRHAEQLRKADIGRGEQRTQAPDIRGDYIQWIDDNDPRPVQADFLQICRELYIDLGRNLFTPLNAFEAHYAYYPKGTHYQKHLDRFQDSNDRVISLVLYLNQDWKENDGGELEIFSESDSSVIEVIVPPTFGKLVVFLSKSIYHAVRPTTSPRYSVTGWVRHQTDAT